MSIEEELADVAHLLQRVTEAVLRWWRQLHAKHVEPLRLVDDQRPKRLDVHGRRRKAGRLEKLIDLLGFDRL